MKSFASTCCPRPSRLFQTRQAARVAVVVACGAWGGRRALAVDRLVPSQYATVQAAIDAAQSGDSVVISPGTYRALNTITGKSLTLRGLDPASPQTVAATILSGDTDNNGVADGTVLNCTGPSTQAVRVEGLTITGGRKGISSTMSLTVARCVISGNVGGGSCGIDARGVLATRIAVVIEDCTITQNQGSNGAISVFGPADALLRRCVFAGNTSIGTGIGGAMLCGESTVMSVTDCEFRDNRATKGAAVYASPRGLATYERCTFVGNSATNEGGAVCSYARLSVSESSFIGNSSGAQGGALCLQTAVDEASQLKRCKLLENSAVTGGGAVYAFSRLSMSGTLAAGNRVTVSGGGGAIVSSLALTMTNCTIVGNFAALPTPYARFAGGIQLSGETASVSNSVVWGNGALPIVSTIPFKLNSCILEGGGLVGGNLASDPLFADPDGPDNDPLTFEDNDYTLLAGSPAIDGGTNIGLDDTQTADLAGNPRFANDPGMPDRGVATATLPLIVDIGAYEFQGQTCRADVDRDGSVMVDDLFGFLDAWFAQNGSHSPPIAASALTADLDFDLAVGVDDLWVYLDAWFAGCP